MSKFAYTYVLKLCDGSFYVGSTPDLNRRIDQHETGRGGRTTELQPGELIYYEACRSLAEARKREKQLKTGYGRAYLMRRLAFEICERDSD
ncbi:GIY-YIG nuclease family protein [Verrucomicrobiota bacterium]